MFYLICIAGGQNLGEIDDIKYFQQKLYRSLNVPISRLEAESGFSLGRSTEITRDELKFTKYIGRLRKKFVVLFHDLLRTQLILKNIVTPEDWDNDMSELVKYDFIQDGYYSEIKESEMLKDRLQMAQDLFNNQMVGKVYSMDFVMRRVLRMSDKDITDQRKKIADEIKQGIIKDPAADADNGGF